MFDDLPRHTLIRKKDGGLFLTKCKVNQLMHGDEVPCYLGHRYLDEQATLTMKLAHVILTILTTLLIMTPHHWKYNEEEILNELKEYITSTYNQHYSAGTDKNPNP